VDEVLLWLPHIDLAASFHPDGLRAVLVLHVHALAVRHWLTRGSLHERYPCDWDSDIYSLVLAGGVVLFPCWSTPRLHGVERNLLLHELTVLPRHLLTVLFSGPNLISIDNFPASFAVEASFVLALWHLLDMAQDNVHGLALKQIGLQLLEDSFGAGTSITISIAVRSAVVVFVLVTIIGTSSVVSGTISVTITIAVTITGITVAVPVTVIIIVARVIHDVNVVGRVCERLANSVGDVHADLLELLLAVGDVHGGAAVVGLLLVVLVRVLRHVRAELVLVEVHGAVIRVEDSTAEDLLSQSES